jgi:hypothetical protein
MSEFGGLLSRANPWRRYFSSYLAPAFYREVLPMLLFVSLVVVGGCGRTKAMSM